MSKVSKAAAAALKAALNPPPADHLTQAKLAKALGVSQQAVSHWSNEKARPEPKHWPDIERLVGIPRTLWMTDEERAAAGLDSADGEAA